METASGFYCFSHSGLNQYWAWLSSSHSEVHTEALLGTHLLAAIAHNRNTVLGQSGLQIMKNNFILGH